MKTLSFALFLLVSSSAAMASSEPKPVVSLLPKVGTVFVNTYFATDSNGMIPPKDSTDPGMPDDTVDVIASAITIHGRPNSVAITARAHSDSTFLSYAANGDVWIWNTGKSKSWQRLSFGSKAGKLIKTKTELDTGSVLGSYYALNKHDEMQVLGWDTLTLEGQPVPVQKLQSVTVMVYDKKLMRGHQKPPGDVFTNATNYWYAPSLGYFVKINFGWDAQYFLNQVLKSVSIPRTTENLGVK